MKRVFDVSRETTAMGTKLPKLERKDFDQRLESLLSVEASFPLVFPDADAESKSVSAGKVSIGSVSETEFLHWTERLWIHYELLTQWNPRLSLVGPGTGVEVIERHYWESMLGLKLMMPSDKYLMDIGSGGGFPGFVLAASNPELSVTLVEPREKKWSFLRSAIRKTDLLSCTALNARVEFPLSHSIDPASEIDVVTSRALTLPIEVLDAFLDDYPHVRILLWVGLEDIALPKQARIHRSIRLPGSDHRKIIEIVRR